MHKINELLDLVKSIVLNAATNIENQDNSKNKNYFFSAENPKEMKAEADNLIEHQILSQLTPLGLPVLSEESGYLPNSNESDFYFIVDPLDGTYNFVKGLGPCGISIALWAGDKPIFGVIYDLVKKQLIYGGADLGSFCEGSKIHVSDTKSKSEASICTGFPVRFDLTNNNVLKDFFEMVSPYAKVRMLGSAAISLVNVGCGISDVYSERSIMLWDVAAGIAIVEGAGGKHIMSKSSDEWSYDVTAYNGHILI
jgi:myo-inositol-1(or 4)-monophosphatase